MNAKTLVIIIFIAVLAGCATPEMSLTTNIQNNIEQVEGVLMIPQNNLDVTVQATNPGNSGLLGALIVAGIDSARRSSAEKEAAPMLESLRDYDFRTVMLTASNNALTKIDKVKFSAPLRVEMVESDSAKKIAFKQSTASAILFCNVNYQLQSGNLIVAVRAEMYPKIDSLKQFRKKPEESNPLDGGNAIYRKTFTFTKHYVTTTTIKNDLSEAAANVAHQLAADLNYGV